MYNWRYHIASLVAVFLALAVGLLLGTIVVERGVVSAQRTTLVAGIQKEIDRVRSSNAGLKSSNEALLAFATEAAPALMRDGLAGRTVIVIADPGSAEAAARAAEAVRVSGGVPVPAVFVGSGLSLGDAKVSQAASQALGAPVASELVTRVVETLAREWTTPGDSRVLTKALVKAGGLQMQLPGADQAVSGVVVTASYGGAPDDAAFRLARALTGPGRFGAGAEISKARTGVAPAAVKAGLSGVDDVETPLGQLSLAWVLTGRATGLYGTAAGVEGPFPKPLFAAP